MNRVLFEKTVGSINVKIQKGQGMYNVEVCSSEVLFSNYKFSFDYTKENHIDDLVRRMLSKIYERHSINLDYDEVLKGVKQDIFSIDSIIREPHLDNYTIRKNVDIQKLISENTYGDLYERSVDKGSKSDSEKSHSFNKKLTTQDDGTTNEFG